MNTNFSFFIENEKLKNGCSFSIFHCPLKIENGNNGMYTDLQSLCNVWANDRMCRLSEM